MRLETPTRLVLYDRSRILGAVRFFRNQFHYHPRIYNVVFSDFAVDRDGIAMVRHLYDAVVDKVQPLYLRTGVDEGDIFYNVLRSLGFRDYRRVYSPTLDVKAFDISRLEAAARDFDALGYRIVRWHELEPSEIARQKLYELHAEIYADTSTVVPATPERFTRQAWLEETLLSSEAVPEACFIAVDADEFIGFSNLFWGEHRGELETGTFGTRRSHRHHHREIVLALKRQEIAYAQTHGYQAIRAEIDAENPWILQICAELPFVQGKDYISMVRVLNWDVSTE